MLIVIFSPLNMQQHKSQKGMRLHQMIKCTEMWIGGISKEPNKYQPSSPALSDSEKRLGFGKEKGVRGGHHGGKYPF